MRCSSCGKKLKDNQKFCIYCGAPVIPAAAPASKKGKIKCPYCRAKVSADNLFCTSCGAALSQAPASPAKYERKEQSAGSQQPGLFKKLLSIAIGIMLVVVIAVGAAYFLRGSHPAEADVASVEGTASQSKFAVSSTSVESLTESSKQPDSITAAPSQPQVSPSPSIAPTAVPTPVPTVVPTPTANVDYIIPDSDSRFITRADVVGLTLQEVNYAKNEIYARHGRIFKSDELADYFSSKSWYVARYDADTFDEFYAPNLNEYEIENAFFLNQIEHEIEPNGYVLDQQSR